MTLQEIKTIVQTILIEDFLVVEESFEWHTKLEELHEEFNILGIFLNFEEHLNNRFEIDILLLENINPTLHSANDIVLFIETQIQAS